MKDWLKCKINPLVKIRQNQNIKNQESLKQLKWTLTDVEEHYTFLHWANITQ